MNFVHTVTGQTGVAQVFSHAYTNDPNPEGKYLVSIGVSTIVAEGLTYEEAEALARKINLASALNGRFPTTY